MDSQNLSNGMECRNILFVRLLVVSICASCWSCLRWECSMQEAFRMLFREAKCTNTRREGWGGEYDFGTEIHKLSYICLFPPYLIFSYTFLLFPVDAYTFQSLKKRMLYVISEHVIYLHYLLIFFVCFVTCTIFSICLNLSSMSAWISVLQGFVPVVQFFCTFLFLGCPK